MKLAIIGYGRMGKAIEKMALSRSHEVIYINNGEPIDKSRLEHADVAIEFTQPDAALENIITIMRHGVSVVSGTTGWLEHKKIADECAINEQKGFLYASNFSLGVNLFFVVNEYLAEMMSNHKEYSPSVHEIHHTGKKDAPSGTAITTAEGIINAYDELNGWTQDSREDKIHITDERINPYCGTHTVTYNSTIDKISLEHHAHSREGFALGAVMAAEWIIGKSGVFSMRDVLGLPTNFTSR